MDERPPRQLVHEPKNVPIGIKIKIPANTYVVSVAESRKRRRKNNRMIVQILVKLCIDTVDKRLPARRPTLRNGH